MIEISFIGLLQAEKAQLTLVAGLKYFPPPKNYDRKLTPFISLV